mgnify:CR=1 FL=1
MNKYTPSFIYIIIFLLGLSIINDAGSYSFTIWEELYRMLGIFLFALGMFGYGYEAGGHKK